MERNKQKRALQKIDDDMAEKETEDKETYYWKDGDYKDEEYGECHD